MMTLSEISCTYSEDAVVFHARILALRAEARAAETREKGDALRRRIAELQALRRQSRELAELTRHYYERNYYRDRKYSL